MSIIGINGKVGSGKDTVGGIIQYLTASKEVKETLTLEEWLESDDLNGRDFNWKIKKFAGKLKEIASLLTGVPTYSFEDQDFKQKYMSEEWNNPNPVIYENGNKAWMPMTYREFLQKLGTEAMREGLHTNVWVNALFADYKTIIYREETKIWETPISKWIITDMRFPNEMEAVVARGGITIRVVRPGTSVGTHPSEIALDDAKFDYEIINNGTIADLIDKVIDILTLEKLI